MFATGENVCLLINTRASSLESLRTDSTKCYGVGE